MSLLPSFSLYIYILNPAEGGWKISLSRPGLEPSTVLTTWLLSSPSPQLTWKWINHLDNKMWLWLSPSLLWSGGRMMELKHFAVAEDLIDCIAHDMMDGYQLPHALSRSVDHWIPLLPPLLPPLILLSSYPHTLAFNRVQGLHWHQPTSSSSATHFLFDFLTSCTPMERSPSSHCVPVSLPRSNLPPFSKKKN